MKLICDANIVIGAHELNIWNNLISRHKIYIASSVVDESRFFRDNLSRAQSIRLKKEIEKNKITLISLPIDEVNLIIKKIKLKNLEIHLGEAESIATMLKPEYNDLYFCTAERVAVYVSYLLEVIDRLISPEKCLRKKIAEAALSVYKKGNG